jgi:flagellar basal body rod protein FlgG
MHGAGRIRQGCLEASNVDVQRTIEEHAALVDLRDRIHALRTE